jgi:acyl-[acyl-carrier-protein]-phospholipid O-acyltransferase / long-chain-fatty-acid--[acyl-carrier-protein] ligase
MSESVLAESPSTRPRSTQPAPLRVPQPLAPFDPLAFDARHADTTLFTALLQTMKRLRKQGGGKRQALEDQERSPLTYERLVLGALVLGAKLATHTRRAETVGILLPNVNGLAVTVFGLNAFGRVAAMLNFTAGLKNLRSAVETGVIRTIITSRRFIETAKLDDLVAGLAEIEVTPGRKVEIIYLESLRKTISGRDKAVGLMRSYYAGRFHRRHGLRPEQPAVVLFTSGTEGSPKGVVLSNRNVIANARQIFAHANGMLTSDDVVMNPLPMFHSFGLTAATIMPLLNGMKVVLYPSPLHYKQVPQLIAATKSTVLFATDTFLQGYARAADASELASIRYVIAGAERVKDATRTMWDKTGALILEGYGATECAPVLACNLPPINMPGTVGPLLPGLESRLEPVEGIHDAGRLVVRGPNIMLGYLLADKPGVIVPPVDGWHDTGDIVTFDNEGRVAIKGRAKRFAKLAGEMISLAAVETMVSSLWPQHNHVVVTLPDPRKGEQLILITDKPDADKASLLGQARAEGFPELWVPKAIMVVGAIPVLGSGKVDFPAAIAMVRQSRPLL